MTEREEHETELLLAQPEFVAWLERLPMSSPQTLVTTLEPGEGDD